MKIINTRLHGILDYIISFVLILPWIVNYNAQSDDTWALAAIGGLLFTVSMITDYEFGLIKIISMKLHIVIDVIFALLLLTSPWLFHFYNFSSWPAALGAIYLIVIFLSSVKPYTVTRRDLDITKPS